MTVPIARVVADPLPARASRRCGSATSPTATAAVRAQRGQPRELLQAGIELIGSPAPEGTAEALTVLCHALDATGLEGYRVGLGDASLFPALMAGLRVSRARPRPACWRRSRAGTSSELERRSGDAGLPAREAELLLSVPQRRGGPEVLADLPRPGRGRGRRDAHGARAARARGRRAGDLRPWPRAQHSATTPAPCSRCTTPRSALRSAAAGATTSCSGASGARCPPSASRSASTACTSRSPGEERGTGALP